MRIFIDADGCPVVGLTIETARRSAVPVTIVCDTAHEFSDRDAEVVTVDKGTDSADFALVNLISAGDICITQDYGLAAMCLAKKAYAISQNGLVYDSGNIDSLLMSRHMVKKLKNSGKRIKGPKKRTDDLNEQFVRSLEELLTRLTQKDSE